MRTSLCSLLVLLASCLAAAADWQAEYGRLLRKYATGSGVRYREWKEHAQDVQALHQVTESIAAAPASSAKSREQLAFHLNAYNAWILREALAKYPTKSVKDPLFTFFIGKRITVAGEKMSFNRLEKDLIRPRFSEPRIHFALNCASRSCPPLRAEPYAAAQLDAQLEEQTRAFINSEKGVRERKGSVELSKIFDWYKEDFAAPEGVPGFINRYRAKPLPASAKLTFQEYDWQLNEAK